MNNTKTLNDICLVSRHDVCLLNMKQVAEKARQIGLLSLAELIESDLKENKITDGNYYPAIKTLFGMQ